MKSPNAVIKTTTLEQPQHFSHQQRKNTNNSVFITYHDESIEIVGLGHAKAGAIYENLSLESYKGFADTLTRMCSDGRYAPAVIWASINDLNRLLLSYPCESIEEDCIHALQALSHLSPAGFFHNVKRILLLWHKLGYSGISGEAAELLSILQSPIPTRPAGSRIRSDDPTEGWYTEQEYDDLVYTLWHDLENGISLLDKSTLCLLSAQYGRRPIQFAHAKIGDLKEHGEAQGVSGKRFEFPGAKEKGAGGFRQSAPEIHPLNEELWTLCQKTAQKTIGDFQNLTGLTLTPEEIFQLPLFSFGWIEHRIERVRKYESKLEFIYSSRLLHCPVASISKLIARRDHGTKIVSERTGKILREGAYRNRYSRILQLARSGIPRAQLQFWIGHKTDKTLDVYYKDFAEQARELRVMGTAMAPIVRAFTGPIRDKESDATRGNDKASRVVLNGRSDSSLGNCGERDACAAGVPIGCYRCPNFEPWLHGPHEQVLEMLIEKEERQRQVPLFGSGHNILAHVDYEREKEAVKHVIAMCKARELILEDQDLG
ncbi:hypothetical protein [Pseudomonas thivervalensis]|uniref:hypothetical protein n=1 Tax=Pseudomonas thivervalensis TaxID=86265 RepID=UPI000A48D7A6|nr:hypothetical protein [Pseudomonas thivervalensis]